MNHNIETEKRICELYLHNTEASEICKEFKISRNVILRILTKHNIPRHRNSQRMGIQKSTKFKNVVTEHESEICDMYINKQISANKIAEYFSIPTRRILETLKKNNIQLRTHSEAIMTKFSLETESKICESYISEKNIREIIEELSIDVSRNSIYRVLNKNNIRIRGNHETTQHITSEIENEICNLYKKELLSLYSLGEKFDVSENFIRRIISKNNISFRKQGLVTDEGKKNIIKSNKNRCGEFSSVWKGGITPLIQQIRISKKYSDWRFQIFKRDKFVCQECSKSKTYIEAHHLKRLSNIMYENRIETLEESYNCPEIWDLSNGITLCEECHNKTIGKNKMENI